MTDSATGTRTTTGGSTTQEERHRNVAQNNRNEFDFPPYWNNEKDWLVECITLLKDDDPEETKETLDYIGRLFAFAFATDTRMLAQSGGDSGSETYELWFSFISEERKSDFLRLIREDGYADPDDDLSFNPPSPAALKGLDDLRPIGSVFPPGQSNYIAQVGTLKLMAMGHDPTASVN
jgi:hypothetical protein